MQGDLEPAGPTSYRPPPEKRWVPPPPEDLHLLMPVDFLNSSLCPKLCLYSGRTESVARIRHFLFVPSADGRLRLPVLIPTAYGERAMHKILRDGLPLMGAGTALPGIPLITYGLVVVAKRLDLFFGDRLPWSILWPAVLLASAFYVGLYGLHKWWVRRRLIGWRLRPALRMVDVTFPEHQRAAFDGWNRALDAWHAAGQPPGDAMAGEEGWATAVETGWDRPAAPLN